jgi:hypothetical protein
MKIWYTSISTLRGTVVRVALAPSWNSEDGTTAKGDRRSSM